MQEAIKLFSLLFSETNQPPDHYSMTTRKQNITKTEREGQYIEIHRQGELDLGNHIDFC
jgi:hypothetical protein